MEDLTRKIGITDKKLRKLFAVYAIVSALFLAILITGIVLRDYARSYDETVKNLEHIRSGLVRIEGATRDIKSSIVTVEKTVPLRLFSESPQRQLLSGLDDLKGNMKYASIHIAEIGTQDNRIALPVTIRGVMTDYSLFVNDIGKLQAMSFPFVNILGIQIRKEEAAAKQEPGPAGRKLPDRVIYEITGEMLTLAGEASPVPGKPETKPERPALFRKGGA